MADKSKIEWTDASWTPIRARNLKTGKIGWHCEHATTGCEFCYAETLNKRLGTGLPFKPGHRSDIEIFLDPQMLLAPLKWKKPRMIFVCSMTDLFADFVPDEWIDKVFAVMALCPQHTFQVLTKRAERMRDYVRSAVDCFHASRQWNDGMQQIAVDLTGSPCAAGTFEDIDWPLPNVWLGVSTERQQEADERIPLLVETPAAVRFISAEPLLGPINLFDFIGPWGPTPQDLQAPPQLDWVIVGGESGHDARPMHPDWARSLRDQCKAASVPFFFKQWGEYLPIELKRAPFDLKKFRLAGRNWPYHLIKGRPEQHAIAMVLLGKKNAGRKLDGITHDAMPSPSDHVIKPPVRRAAGE